MRVKPHLRPRDESECNYLPITTETGSEFCTKCGWTGLGHSQSDVPIRQRSAHGVPKPETSIERTCRTCHASFLGLAAGKTGERGLWRDWVWYCSIECDPEDGVYPQASESEGS